MDKDGNCGWDPVSVRCHASERSAVWQNKTRFQLALNNQARIPLFVCDYEATTNDLTSPKIERDYTESANTCQHWRWEREW